MDVVDADRDGRCRAKEASLLSYARHVAGRANVCPRCGSTVSQFAAGCAICGADLERHRRSPGARLTRTVRTSPLPRWGSELGERVLLTVILVALALFAPLYGFLFSMLVAWDRNRRGQRAARNIALACVLLAALSFLGPLIPGLGPHA